MDWVLNLQKAIDYMEKHILEPINYEDVARHIYTSNYHFHRTFSLMVGITANEYIKNRRLSMAGHDLAMSKMKVIDVAMKYGYDSPESFTKAFTRFHGITPNAAKRSGAKLKSFNRLIIKIKVEGGTVMDYRIEKNEGFKLLVKREQFRNEIISQEDNTEIPEFWERCNKAGVSDFLRSQTGQSDIYGACTPISKESNYFMYGIGMKYEGDQAPEGYEIWEVKPMLWAVFKCIGENPDCIGDVWNRIFSEFLPCSEYNMLDEMDFELYPMGENADCFCEIWIPVGRK